MSSPTGSPKRTNFATSAPWESRYGYSRGVRVGGLVFVTGTVGLGTDGQVGAVDAGGQARRAIEIIQETLERAGASLTDVVRTRLFVTNIERDAEAVGLAHAEFFGDIRPCTTMVEVRALIRPEFLVEIEADAVISARDH